MPSTMLSASIRSPSLELDDAAVVHGADLDAHLQRHAELGQPARDALGGLGAEALELRRGFLADERHAGAPDRERGGELAADEPAAEHDGAGARLGSGGDAFAVGALAHRLDPRVAQAGEVGAGRCGAGGEHDRSARERVAVERDGARASGSIAVDFAAEAQLDAVLLEPVRAAGSAARRRRARRAGTPWSAAAAGRG